MAETRRIPELLTDVMEHMSLLFQKEVHLAKAEASEKVSQVRGAAVSLAVGGVILLAALVILLHSAVWWLVELGLEIQWSTLAVGVIVALIGYAFLQRGISRMRATSLAPKRSMNQMQRDAGVVREQWQ